MVRAITCWWFGQAEEPRLWELCRDLDSLKSVCFSLISIPGVPWI